MNKNTEVLLKIVKRCEESDGEYEITMTEDGERVLYVILGNGEYTVNTKDEAGLQKLWDEIKVHCGLSDDDQAADPDEKPDRVQDKDLISREKAIKTLNARFENDSGEGSSYWYDADVLDTLQDLPPAQPKTANAPNEDLINREEAIQELQAHFANDFGRGHWWCSSDVLDVLIQLPPAYKYAEKPKNI